MGAVAVNTTVSWTAANGGDHAGMLVARAKGCDVIACAVCGFRHVVPLPDAAALEQAYCDDEFTHNKPNVLTDSTEDSDWSALARRDRLECFERLLPPGKRRLLDIGCGSGLFLRTAHERGWRVKGLEPLRRAAAHARALGLDVTDGFFNAAAARTLPQFDAVNLNNVLEHAPNPFETIALAREVLTPSGVLCLNVPNDFSAFQVSARASLSLSEWWVSPRDHLNYFDFESLSSLVTRSGFAIAERSTSFPMELFLLMGLDYTNDPELGQACHGQRRRFELALESAGFGETRRAFYRALANAGIGQEAMIVAIKR